MYILSTSRVSSNDDLLEVRIQGLVVVVLDHLIKDEERADTRTVGRVL